MLDIPEIMKNRLAILAFSILIFGCKNKASEQPAETDLASHYESFGAKVHPDNFKNTEDMETTYANLKKGDTVDAKFEATVNSVCKMKGCWMVLDFPGEDDPMVKFKDYGFFVPKDIEGKKVIVSGKAYLAETSVEDQKHFAEDAGKSEEEIAAITNVETSPAFLADGVLIEK